MPSYESSMRNLAKARARWRPPRPWRSTDESRMIRRYVFVWYTGRGSKPSGRARGCRSWFGNFRQIRAKCIGKSDAAVSPHTRNSLERTTIPKQETGRSHSWVEDGAPCFTCAHQFPSSLEVTIKYRGMGGFAGNLRPSVQMSRQV